LSAEQIRKVVDEKLTELDWEIRPIGGKHDRNSSL
jgi:hypothetical protein